MDNHVFFFLQRKIGFTGFNYTLLEKKAIGHPTMDLNPPPPIFLRRFKECLQQVSVTLVGFKLHSSYLSRRESIEIAPEVTLCDRY